MPDRARQVGARVSGAEILVDALRKEGVTLLFGYPGGMVISIFDVLNRCDDINLVLTRHEQAAIHAADGYARATGKVGVCLVTSGPGATNTITGIATAKLDSIPLVVISGQVRTTVLGSDAFQETDMVGLTRPICKHNYLVQSIEDLPASLKNAFHIARTGRPGPVSVDLPVDVAEATLKDYSYPTSVHLPGYSPTLKGNHRQVVRLSQAIGEANRPLICAGGGVISSEAGAELVAFMEKTNIPAVVTLMGLGVVPSDHPLFLGMPGMHGCASANFALAECDLLIGMGTRFDDRVTSRPDSFAKNARIAHIDIDPSEIGKNVKADIPVVGDVKSVLSDLIALVRPKSAGEWVGRTLKWKEGNRVEFDQAECPEILPQFVIRSIARLVKSDAVVVTDVGQHQMWSALHLDHGRPRSFISSGGLGTMGFGLPAAMGAALGSPERPVVCISGDGSIQMNIQELATCAINRIPVRIVVLNNSYLGLVRQWQELFWDKNYAKTCLRQGPDCPKRCSGPGPDCPEKYLPDLVKVAQANGVEAWRAEKPGEVESVLRRGLECPGPVLMEFMVRRLENVFPMVPSGKPITEIITRGA
ncbi:MAG: acetolactate synthase, large subunit, biosynthetic type [Candidatus Aminicenantes bacterium RBG_16_63_16]|nr:MAG: acetolactate synthase, large subunit, biosynthetic type [Candidatus Aminicenantes bacterium RBG_16_63_16]